MPYASNRRTAEKLERVCVGRANSPKWVLSLVGHQYTAVFGHSMCLALTKGSILELGGGVPEWVQAWTT